MIFGRRKKGITVTRKLKLFHVGDSFPHIPNTFYTTCDKSRNSYDKSTLRRLRQWDWYNKEYIKLDTLNRY